MCFRIYSRVLILFLLFGLQLIWAEYNDSTKFYVYQNTLFKKNDTFDNLVRSTWTAQFESELLDFKLSYDYQTENQANYYLNQTPPDERLKYDLTLYHDNVNVRYGYFYESFGNGLVLNATEDIKMALNPIIKGTVLNYQNDLLKLKFLSGEWTNFFKENEQIYGAQGNIEHHNLKLGLAAINHTKPTGTKEDRHSILLGFTQDSVTFEAELAKGDQKNSAANYMSLNIQQGNFNHFVEYVDYRNYSFDNYSIYRGPLGINASEFELPYLVFPELIMSDQKAYHYQASYFTDTASLYSFSYSKLNQITDHYEEIALKLKKAQSFWGFNDHSIVYSYQTFKQKTYHSLLNKAFLDIYSNTLECLVELQFNEQENTLIHKEELGFVLNLNWMIKVISYTKDKSYFSWALSYSNLEKQQFLNLIVGEKPAGTICVDGICVFNPLISGISLTWQQRF